MAQTRFAITRPDGRSHSQVLLDHVRPHEPGHIFTYDELIGVLSDTTDHTQTVENVQRIVQATQKRLLRQQQRTLKAQTSVGYQLAYACEQMGLSGDRSKRSMNQLEMARLLLEEVRWDELDPNAKKAHQGMLLVMQGFWGQLNGHEQRIRKIERALDAARRGHASALVVEVAALASKDDTSVALPSNSEGGSARE